MKKDPTLPPCVFEHGRWYRILVDRKWQRLSPISAGLPAMWRAYAALGESDEQMRMPGLVAEWEDKVLALRAPKTRLDTKARTSKVAVAFAEFRPSEVQPPHCVEFLSAWSAKPRSFNAYRALLSELFRYAIETGRRPVGTNPVRDVIRTKAEKPRERCPTTSEIRRVKIGCVYGMSGGRVNRKARTRQGIVMAAFIELAYLSGQDVGRIVLLRDTPNRDEPSEPHVTADGLSFRRSKTGGRVVISFTPRLLAAVEALRAIRAERRKKTGKIHPYLLTRQDGTPMTYEAMANAWQRGIKRSGVAHFMARDIRARALTDKDSRDGRREANAMGTHATEGQTATYIRHKTPRTTKATA